MWGTKTDQNTQHFSTNKGGAECRGCADWKEGNQN